MDSDPEGKTLKKQAVDGVKWTGASAIFNKAMSLVKVPILARLLAPTDFGLVGMLQTVLMFSNPLADMGLGAAIIQKRDVTHVQLSTIYWLNLAVGLVTFFGLLLISPLVAQFYNEERLEHLMIFVALIFLTRPLGSQFQKLMEKHLKFGLTTQIDIAANIISFFITLTLAWLGWGVYSLLYGRLSAAIINSGLLIGFGLRIHRPGFHFNLRDSRDLISFGGYQLGERFLKILSSNLDKLLIGKFLGAEVLGYYTIAYTLVIIPVFTINPLITKVTFPIFSILQDNQAKINRYYTKALNILVTLNFPIYAGMILTAPDFVPLVFGEQWLESVVVIQILSLEALLWTISNPLGSILLAKGRADISFRLNIMKALSLALCIFAAYSFVPTIVSIAWGIVVSRYLVDPFIHFYMHKAFGVKYDAILRNICTILLFSLAMIASAYSMNFMGIENLYLLLALKVCLGAIVYLLLLAFFGKESRELLLSLKGG